MTPVSRLKTLLRSHPKLAALAAAVLGGAAFFATAGLLAGPAGGPDAYDAVFAQAGETPAGQARAGNELLEAAVGLPEGSAERTRVIRLADVLMRKAAAAGDADGRAYVTAVDGPPPATAASPAPGTPAGP